MHTTMANETFVKEWKTFLKCKECWEFKELWKENWYLHKEWYLWVLGRCKECILKWRKTEHELEMARERDRDRYLNNPHRRAYLNECAKKRTERHLKENSNWILYHGKTDKMIKSLWIRPKICPICWYEWRIMAHHPDINKWNEIVFCCQPCHNKIHNWKMECPKVIELPLSCKKTKWL